MKKRGQWCLICKKCRVLNPEVSFHRFPTNPQERSIWFSIIGRDNERHKRKSASICSDHFAPGDMLERSNGSKYILPGRVPNLHPTVFSDASSCSSPEPDSSPDSTPPRVIRYSKVPSNSLAGNRKRWTNESQEPNQAAVCACKIGNDSGTITDKSNCLEHSNQVVGISYHGDDIGDRLGVHENDKVQDNQVETQIKREIRSDDNRNVEESNLVRVSSSEVGNVDVLRTDKKDIVLEKFKSEIKEEPISDDVIPIEDSNSVGVSSHEVVNVGDENDVVSETQPEPKIKEEIINDDVRIEDSNLVGVGSHEVVNVGELSTDENDVALETTQLERKIEEGAIIDDFDRIEDGVDTRPVIIRTVDGERLYITTEMGPIDVAVEELGFDDNTSCTSLGGEEILTDQECDQAQEKLFNTDGEQETVIDNIEESNQMDSVSSREVERSLNIEDLCTITEKDAYLDAIETIEKEYQYSTNEQDNNRASNTDSYTEILEDQIDLTNKVEEREIITIEDSDQEEPDVMQECLEDTFLSTSDVVTCVTCSKEILDCSCMLVAIRNKPLPMGTPHRALKSIPKGTLSTGVTYSKFPAIFADKPIPKNVYFGPYEGQLDRILDCHVYGWKLESGKLVDTSDEANSNYLRYVKFTPRVGLQNIYMFQHEGELYYRTTRDVKKNEQLYLYIDTKYHNNYYIPPKVQIEADIPTCTVCYLGFQTTQHFLRHESVCKSKIDDDLHKCCFCAVTIKTVDLRVAHEEDCSSTNTKHGQKVDPKCEDICCNENVAKKNSVLGTRKSQVKKAQIRDYILNRNAESVSERPDDCNDLLQATDSPNSSPKKHRIEKSTVSYSVDSVGTQTSQRKPQKSNSSRKIIRRRKKKATDAKGSNLILPDGSSDPCNSVPLRQCGILFPAFPIPASPSFPNPPLTGPSISECEPKEVMELDSESFNEFIKLSKGFSEKSGQERQEVTEFIGSFKEFIKFSKGFPKKKRREEGSAPLLNDIDNTNSPHDGGPLPAFPILSHPSYFNPFLPATSTSEFQPEEVTVNTHLKEQAFTEFDSESFNEFIKLSKGFPEKSGQEKNSVTLLKDIDNTSSPHDGGPEFPIHPHPSFSNRFRPGTSISECQPEEVIVETQQKRQEVTEFDSECFNEFIKLSKGFPKKRGRKRGSALLLNDIDNAISLQDSAKRRRNYWQVPRLYSMNSDQLTRYYQQREKKIKKSERKTVSQLNVSKSNEHDFDSEVSRYQPPTISSFPQNDEGQKDKSVEENLDAVNAIECVYLQENNTGIDTFQPQFSITAPKKRGRPKGKSKSRYQLPHEQQCESADGTNCSVYEGYKKNERCGCRPYLTVNSPPKKRGRPLGSKNRPKLSDQNSNDFINLRDLSIGTSNDIYQGHVVGMEMNRYQGSEDPLLIDSVSKKRGRPLGSKNRRKGRQKGHRKIITQSSNDPLTSIEKEPRAESSMSSTREGYEIDTSIETEPCEESSMNCTKENYEIDTNIEKDPCDESSVNSIKEKYEVDAIIGEEPCDASPTNRIKSEYEIDAFIEQEPCDKSYMDSTKEEYEVDAIIGEEPCDKSSTNSIKEEYAIDASIEEEPRDRIKEEYEIDTGVEEEPCDESSVNSIKEKYEVDAVVEEEPWDESSTNSIKEEYEIDASIEEKPCEKTSMNNIKEESEIDLEEPCRAMQ